MQTVKLQVNFIAVGTPQLQGDTGANTSVTDAIGILHEYQQFDKPEVVGVYLQNDDSMEPTTFKAYRKGYIYIYLFFQPSYYHGLGNVVYVWWFQYSTFIR